ncbi:NAD(P)-dependent oxidoreductase, partial [bacterium]
MTANTPTVGFIGLGVMGGPMCRNVALKHSGRVLAFDMNADAVSILQDTKGERAASVSSLAEQADLVLLSLPGGPQVKAVAAEIARHAKPGTTIVDLSTTPVALAREVAGELASSSID